MTSVREAPRMVGVRTAPQGRIGFTVGEEIVHAVSHGVGALFAVIGGIALVLSASARDGVVVVGAAIYGATLVTVFLASTFCHAAPQHLTRTRTLLQRVDHGAIYLQIAGTYTPFCLFIIPGPWGPRLLVAIWALAAIGVANTMHSLLWPMNALRERAYRRRSLVLYLTMGWLAVVAFKPLVQALPAWPLALVFAGGLAYTVGVAFFVSSRKWSHSVWHGFVLVGAAAHFFAVFLLV